MKFIKFLGVGGTATAIHYVLLILLVEFSDIAPVIGSTLGYIVSGIVNYTLNYYFTFDSREKHGLAAPKFAVVAGIGLAINGGIVYLLTEVLTVYYVLAQIIATAIVLMWNFFVHKHWTYRSV